MTFGLLAGGPLQMLFSLLLMQGLSLTMWRTFLNQAIPRFDPLRFNVNLGNNREMTTTTAAPIIDQRLLPLLSLLAPMAQQQQHHQMQPSVQQPVPQVIVVPMRQTGSASTHIPVQVEAPEPEIRMYKRMLERPPKTTRRPKVVNRMHGGALHVSFVTPRIPAGFSRYIISAVTAKIEPQNDTILNNTSNGVSIDLEQQSLYPVVLRFPNNTDSNSTEVAEPILDNNDMNEINETFVHKDFIDHINNVTNLSQIETNQSPDESRKEIYFENSKGGQNYE